MAYFTESELENYILEDIDPSFSTWIAAVIAQVTEYIENYCGIDFENAAVDTKYFDGSGLDELVVGEFQSLTSVQILSSDGAVLATLTADTDYFAYPYNETVKSILKLSPSGAYVRWPEGTRTVKIAGTFGRSAAPGPVKLAAIKLAAKVINEGLRGGQVSGEGLGDYRVDFKELDESVDSLGIKEILNQYRAIGL